MCNDRPQVMETAALKEGHLCGSWEMKKKLGMGGFGNVFLFEHLVSMSNYVTIMMMMMMMIIIMAICTFAGVRRKNRCETLPPGIELCEQEPLDQRDSDHEEVSQLLAKKNKKSTLNILTAHRS